MRSRESADRRAREDEDLTRAVAEVPSQMPREDLPVVNTRTDPRVFAFLDECCNRTCHPHSWYKHAYKRGM